MDDDDFRRGKPTVHKPIMMGRCIVGDALITKAFELLFSLLQDIVLLQFST